jgi:hypothetical protein
VVECNLAKVEVAGSNPVSRSKKHLKASSNDEAFFVSEVLVGHFSIFRTGKQVHSPPGISSPTIAIYAQGSHGSKIIKSLTT